MDNLYETYENCLELVGQRDDAQNILLPIAHSMQNAQIEVVVTLKGEFQSARLLSKEEAETVIPVTEDSAAKANGITPHPLHDKLIYVAGDYKKYVDDKKAEECFDAYITQLKGWVTSKYTNQSVQVIYSYLSKGQLISDLVKYGVLILNDGKLDLKVKIQTTYKQSDAFVRFRVDDLEENQKPLWLNKDFYESYKNYYVSTRKKDGLCYITGKEDSLCEKHPSRIRHAADKAKLISANDESGFTYRGRFNSKQQAVGVSYIVSQEAHNALKWLLKKQGYTRDGISLVAWETQNKELPDLMADTYDLMGDLGLELGEQESIIDTAESYAKNLKLAILGYKKEINASSKVTVLSIDAATPGRMSIVYYREIAGSDFLEHIQKWHTTCSWIHNYRKKDDHYITFVGAPSLRDIIIAAYGTEQGDFLKVSDKLMAYTMKRLLPCVLEGNRARLPYDIVRAAYNRAIQPLAMNDRNWNRVMTIACSLIRKYRYDRCGEEWSMYLDKDSMNYDYLCGRLLAIADEIERWALNKQEENRPTNAKRYFNQFAKNPCKVWSIINNKLQPYEARLGYRCKELTDLREELSHQLDPEKFQSLRNLGGAFVLGYDSQKREFKMAREKRKAERNNNDIEKEIEE